MKKEVVLKYNINLEDKELMELIQKTAKQHNLNSEDVIILDPQCNCGEYNCCICQKCKNKICNFCKS